MFSKTAMEQPELISSGQQPLTPEQQPLTPEQRRELLLCVLDPVLFAERILGVQLWSAEVEMLRSIERNRRTAIRAGHGCPPLTFDEAIKAIINVDSEKVGIISKRRQVKNKSSPKSNQQKSG